ncbi:MAG: flagellar biosynthesis anti-sigma factor FlgM [Gammaproteobacteria bacterium]
MEISGANSRKTDSKNDKSVSSVSKPASAGASAKSGAASGAKSGSSDTVSLTDTAARLKELEMGLASQPVVDTQRVQSVQSAINDGTFEVDPDSVAEKMINFETGLDETS